DLDDHVGLGKHVGGRLGDGGAGGAICAHPDAVRLEIAIAMKDGLAKYSCSASPLILGKCRTAIYGFGGGGVAITNKSPPKANARQSESLCTST
ncbi:hypothetical protein, partial [Mesorhizobium sp.]|uniref:hypothetical protein n=1 Tax=Mesorhizobium sp. TaxID=1871066 RepID=UPI0025801870